MSPSQSASGFWRMAAISSTHWNPKKLVLTLGNECHSSWEDELGSEASRPKQSLLSPGLPPEAEGATHI